MNYKNKKVRGQEENIYITKKILTTDKFRKDATNVGH